MLTPEVCTNAQSPDRADFKRMHRHSATTEDVASWGETYPGDHTESLKRLQGYGQHPKLPLQLQADAPLASHRDDTSDSATRSHPEAARSGSGDDQDETGRNNGDVTTGSGAHGGDSGRSDEAAWEDILDVPGIKQVHPDSASGTPSDTVAPEDGSAPGPDASQAEAPEAPDAEHSFQVRAISQLRVVPALQAMTTGVRAA